MILIIGGTDDAIKLGKLIKEIGRNAAVSAATEYGKKVIKEHNLIAFEKRLGGNEMDKVLADFNIKALIDASHPYSTTVTYNAKKACDKLNIPFLRYERPETVIPETLEAKNNIIRVKNFLEAGKKAVKLEGNILLTTGSKNLKTFIDSLSVEKSRTEKKDTRLYVRILPEKESIVKCHELGISPDQIIAIKGPLDYNLNRAIMESYNIRTVVTKDSGDTGGTLEKINAALDLDIYVIIIERPGYEDISINLTRSKERVLDWIERI